MKKRIRKRFGALLLVCCMVVLNFAVLLIPASAEETSRAEVYEQYTNLNTKETNLLDGYYEYIENLENDSEFYNLSFGDVIALSGGNHDGQMWVHFELGKGSYSVELEVGKYYVMKHCRSYLSMYLTNSAKAVEGINIKPPVWVGDTYQVDADSYIFRTDSDYRYLYLFDDSYLHEWCLYEVESFQTTYDVSKTSFKKDMEEIFPDVYKTLGEYPDYHSNTTNFAKLIAIWDEVPDSGSTVTRSPYLYIYSSNYLNLLDSVSLIDGNGRNVSMEFFSSFHGASGRQPFYKFRVNNWQATLANGTETFHMKELHLTYEGETEPTVFEIDADLTVTKTADGTSFEINSDSVVCINLGYTYWREGNFSSKGVGWHNQIDSVYFGVPNYLLNNQELVNAQMEYQQVTTKPIVVTKTNEYIQTDPNGPKTYVHEWFETTASIPENELTGDWGWVRYQKGVPYFYTVDEEYSFNLRAGPYNHSLKSIYWAFDVEDPTKVSKTNGLTSGELVNSKAVVTGDRLLNWMYDYSLEGATETISIPQQNASPIEVNAILFDVINPREPHNSRDVNGVDVATFGSTHNFFENLGGVGWNYAWAYLTGKAPKDGKIEKSVVKFDEVDEITNVGKSDEYFFNVEDTETLRQAFLQCQSNDETLHLVHFNMSQYYSASFADAKYREGNEDDAKEEKFDGYLAIEDLYLGLKVVALEFQDKTGKITVVKVVSDTIDCAAGLSPAPGSKEVNETAGQVLRNAGLGKLENLLSLLIKIGMVILTLIVILVVLRIVSAIGGSRRSNTVVIHDDAPPRNRRRRR